MKKKKKKILLSVFCVFVALVVSAVSIYYFGDSYPEFYELSTKEFNIPGLETDFVPQGLEYSKQHQKFVVGGYMNKGEPSRIYIVDKLTGNTEKYFTITVNGKAYSGHCGGITVYGDNAWIVGDKIVYRFNFEEALMLQNGESIEIIDGFTPGNGADFVLTYNNYLIVGEFYRKGSYEAPTNHHISFADGTENFALSYIYSINLNNPYGIESITPIACLSMPNQVQGMTFTKDGNIVLSSSFSIPASKISIYQNVLETNAEISVNINNNQIPTYVLNDENIVKQIKTPPMSEEVVLVDNKVYVLFESNCSKYRLINRERLSNVYALDI